MPKRTATAPDYHPQVRQILRRVSSLYTSLTRLDAEFYPEAVEALERVWAHAFVDGEGIEPAPFAGGSLPEADIANLCRAFLHAWHEGHDELGLDDDNLERVWMATADGAPADV